MDTLGAAAAAMAHDINNLMTVVSGNAELLAAGALGEREALRVQHITWAADNAARLTSQALSVSAHHTRGEEYVDLADALRDIDRFLLNVVQKGVDVRLDYGHGAWRVRIDVNELNLAILNLIKNASDASLPGGQIVVGIRSGRDTASATVEIVIADDGCGMSSDVLARATEPFFTTKEAGRGTGLGLPAVAAFCEKSGGRLAIETEQDKGTTIRLVFPRAT